MTSDPSSTPTPRQWHRVRRNSIDRPSSSSSLSSADPSHPSTPQDAVFPHIPAQVTPKAAVSICEDYWSQKHRDRPAFSSGPPSEHSMRELKQTFKDERSRWTDIPSTRTQTIASITVSRRDKPEHMRVPFPVIDQHDSTSLTESQVGQDAAPTYDDEFGGISARHPLRNRVNSKSSSLSFTHGDCFTVSPTKPQRNREQTYRLETHTFPSNLSAAAIPRASLSLRMKSKKTHSQRGAMNLFKSLSSSPQWTPATEFEDIEFDWAEQRREELEKRARQLDQEFNGGGQAQIIQSDDEDGQAAVRPQRRSWELTPEEFALRRELEAEDAKRFTFKDHVWVNSSYVSPHPKETVPYPLAYDKVNLQADRHSHDLVKQIFSGRPSIHDDISHRHPATVLDLGCGDGSWVVDATQSWNNTLFYGLDLQDLHPSNTQLVAELGEQAAENIRFTYFNFINDKLPYLDDKFDMVRMANLKWAIPEYKWDFVLEEVHRVLKRGGWVEIIDDDFVLPTAPDSAHSPEQLASYAEMETRFKDMLQERNLPLNTPSKFMADKLGRHFNACHEEDFAVAISKARPVSLDMYGQSAVPVPLPSEGMSHKAAKLMGIGFEDKHLSSGKLASRSRSGSVGSTTSHLTKDGSVTSQTPEDQEQESYAGSIKQRAYQPLGLEVYPGRFIPFPPSELNAHAVRNMQSILACKEAIRAKEHTKNPELASLEIKDELLPEEKRRFRQLSCEWDEQRRAFDDAFWDFESAMLKRLCLPQRFFDIDDEEDVHKSANGGSRHQPSWTVSGRSKSQRGSDVSLSLSTASTSSAMASTASVASSTTSPSLLDSNIPVRFIRVYSGWK